MVYFGPGGNQARFYDEGNQSSVQVPQWLRNMGLSAYEYQCNKGVKVGRETAEAIGKAAKENDIFLSIHAPYYISMASLEEEKRINSKRYIIESMTAANYMGAQRVVVHTGGVANVDRNWALESAKTVLRDTLKEADELGLGHVHICPELLGKINQLGNLPEIIEMCKIDERMIPTIDVGHYHARDMGALKVYKDYEIMLDQIETGLGLDRLKQIHIHFSRIEFTKGGEKMHWTLNDTQHGPNFEPLAELIYKKNMSPVIICESKDVMADDALKLKQIYEGMVPKGENK